MQRVKQLTTHPLSPAVGGHEHHRDVPGPGSDRPSLRSPHAQARPTPSRPPHRPLSQRSSRPTNLQASLALDRSAPATASLCRAVLAARHTSQELQAGGEGSRQRTPTSSSDIEPVMLDHRGSPPIWPVYAPCRLARLRSMFTFSLDADVCLRLLEDDDADELYELIAGQPRSACTAGCPGRPSRRPRGQRRLSAQAVSSGLRTTGFRRGSSSAAPSRESSASAVWTGQTLSKSRLLVRRSLTRTGNRDQRHARVDRPRIQRLAAQPPRDPCGNRDVSSQRIPERLGLTKEGIMREAERIGDRYIDHVLYSTLASDWKRSEIALLQSRRRGGLARTAAPRCERSLSGSPRVRVRGPVRRSWGWSVGGGCGRFR